MPRWSIDIRRKKGEHLGVVDAPNAQEAKLKAISAFGIPPERQNRIVVSKLDNRDRKVEARRRSRETMISGQDAGPPLFARNGETANE
jgi:hypothetical protein